MNSIFQLNPTFICITLDKGPNLEDNALKSLRASVGINEGTSIIQKETYTIIQTIIRHNQDVVLGIIQQHHYH